jgi:hypothetical protein
VGPRRYGRRKADRRAVRPRRSRHAPGVGHAATTSKRVRFGLNPCTTRLVTGRWRDHCSRDAPEGSSRPSRGGRIGVVKHSAVRTGRLRRSPAVHSRPIDLVVFQEPSHSRAGNLVLEGASRLDAFSAYPVPTWLPGGAPSGTAGTPEVGPPQSSRTRGDAPQVSSAHGR